MIDVEQQKFSSVGLMNELQKSKDKLGRRRNNLKAGKKETRNKYWTKTIENFFVQKIPHAQKQCGEELFSKRTPQFMFSFAASVLEKV